MRKRLFEAWPSKETSSWWDAGARLSLPFYRTSCTSGWWHRLAFDRFLPPASRNRPTYLAPVQPLLWPQNLFPTAYGTPGSPGSLVRELSFPFSCREPDRVYRRKLDYIESPLHFRYAVCNPEISIPNLLSPLRNAERIHTKPQTAPGVDRQSLERYG